MALLFCVLLLLFFISLITSYKGMILSPQVGVIAGFLLSVGYGFSWVNEYEISLSDRTMTILIVGCSLFVFSCFLFQLFFGTFGMGRSKIHKDIIGSVSYIETWKLSLFLAFQIIIFSWLILFLAKLGGTGKITDAIYVFRHANTFTEDKIKLPRLLNLLRRISIGSGYFWGYYLIYTLIKKGKTNKGLLASNLLFGVINNIVLGARTGAIIVLVALVTLVYTFTYINKKKKIRMRTVLLGIIIFLAVGFSFKQFGSILGRDIQFDFSEYLAIYLSAEIKNLDTFVRNNPGGATLYNCQTLIYLINWFSGKFGLPNWTHELDVPFYHLKGHNLGNVSTMFYAFYYDDGLRGVIIYTIIMAFISSYVFVKAINDCKRNSNRFSFSLLFYSYMYFCFLFSFFSNKFYEHIFNPYTMIWFFLCWKALDIYTFRIKINTNERSFLKEYHVK